MQRTGAKTKCGGESKCYQMYELWTRCLIGTLESEIDCLSGFLMERKLVLGNLMEAGGCP